MSNIGHSTRHDDSFRINPRAKAVFAARSHVQAAHPSKRPVLYRLYTLKEVHTCGRRSIGRERGNDILTPPTAGEPEDF